jgi:NADP-dependent 3-hydroxy acid dehydrogenase YdfG
MPPRRIDERRGTGGIGEEFAEAVREEDVGIVVLRGRRIEEVRDGDQTLQYIFP